MDLGIILHFLPFEEKVGKLHEGDLEALFTEPEPLAAIFFVAQ